MTSVLDIFPTLMDLCKVNFSKSLDLDGVFKQAYTVTKFKVILAFIILNKLTQISLMILNA